MLMSIKENKNKKFKNTRRSNQVVEYLFSVILYSKCKCKITFVIQSLQNPRVCIFFMTHAKCRWQNLHHYETELRIANILVYMKLRISNCKTFFHDLTGLIKRIQINTTGATSGAGTENSSGERELTSGLQWGSCYSICSFMCMLCRSLFVLLYFFFWPLCFLFFFDIRILITPLVSSNSYIKQILQETRFRDGRYALYYILQPPLFCLLQIDTSKAYFE